MNGRCACGGIAPPCRGTAPVTGRCACGGTAPLWGGTAPRERLVCLRRSVGIWRDIGHRRNGCRCLFPCALRRDGGRCGLRFRLGFCGFCERCSLRRGLGRICGGIRHRFCRGCRRCAVHKGSLCKGFLLLLHLEISPFQNGQHSLRHTGEMLPVIFGKSVVLFQVVIALAAEVGAFSSDSCSECGGLICGRRTSNSV